MSISQPATLETPAPVGAENEATSLPAHLVRLPSSREWALWRWTAVRGAGFPAALVLKLSQPESAAAAERLFQVEEEARAARRAALAAVNKTLDELRASSAWDDKSTRAPMTKALRLMKADKLPEAEKLMGDARTAVEALRAAGAQLDLAAADFRRAYERGSAQTSLAIHELLNAERFCEALIWQNRRAFHSGMDSLRRIAPAPETSPHGFKQRQNEQLVASYVQRYGVKNDTIGFFGPVGWAKVRDAGAAIEVRPGAGLLSKRTVYFESWCVDAIAELFSRDVSYRRWAAPRLLPYYYVEGATLHRPKQPPATLPAEMAAVLRACDGSRPAHAIAAALTRAPGLRLKSETEVYNLLDRAVGEGLIIWAFECQVGPTAEHDLRSQFERITDGALRTPALAALEEMEQGRRAVARAAGDASALDRALGELDEKFSRLSGIAPTRAAGEMYAGRTLVYEDCQRDLELDIGPEVVRALDAPLQLLLTSARWFTHEAGKVYRRFFQEGYDELAALTGSAIVDGVAFWRKVQMALLDEKKALINPCLVELQRRWAQVLALDTTQSRVAVRGEDLRVRVAAAFAAPGAGWRLARYHSPDLMIAARNAEEIRRGHFQLVLGELLLSYNTLTSVTFAEQHPAREELLRATELDLPEPCVVPIPPRHMPGMTTRTSLSLVTEKDYLLALSYDACSQRPSHTISLGSLLIERGDGGLVARTRDGSLRFDILELFGGILSLLTADGFRLMPKARHTPRVSIDRLVVRRESWCYAAAELAWAKAGDEAGRFLGAQRWAREWGLPRRVFVKVACERKPLYVDMDSPVRLEVLARAVRRAGAGGDGAGEGDGAAVEVTEMLPGVEEAWLSDAAGERYTSELRFVAVDLMS